VIPEFLPDLAALCTALGGTTPAYSIAKAQAILEYVPRHSWRDHVA
jgi:hypothetical protein